MEGSRTPQPTCPSPTDTVSELVRSSQAPLQFGRASAPTVLGLGLLALAVYVMLPLIAPILVGAWVANVARPLVPMLMRGVRAEKAATVVTTLLVLSVLVPIAILCVMISLSAVELWQALVKSPSVQAAFEHLAHTNAGPTGTSNDQLMQMAQQFGSSTLSLASGVLGAAGEGALQIFVLVLSTYGFLAYNRRFYSFCLGRLPLAPMHVERFRLAFHETGRGLLIGTGLTCLVQASVATVVYLSLGVPRALVLGGITFVTSFIPGIGPGLVWVPIAVGLALTGHPVKAVIMGVLGAGVIGMLDNLLRPWIAQRVSLALPPIVVLLSMLGGMAMLGGWGLLLGPLVIRLALEAFELLREQNGQHPPADAPLERKQVAREPNAPRTYAAARRTDPGGTPSRA